MGVRTALLGLAAVLALVVPVLSPAATLGDADVAALQVGLHARGLYEGNVDGLVGNQTLAGLRRLPGATTALSPTTREALGRFGRHTLGSRQLVPGTAGWDVAALQFLLAWHGFPSGTFDGRFGPRTEAALVAFQAWAGVPPIGVGGPLTRAALSAPLPRSPIHLAWPLAGPPGDGFGPRGDAFHAGLDILAPAGTPVAAAGDGVVVAAGRDGAWGQLVEVRHARDVTTLYAHLSAVLVEVGEHVSAGTTIGLVGSTGNATGPHLHLEVRVRGACVDPMTALG
jgi:peptidoglycan hydrolase-like protein with peptidoglycan-binding domain